MNKITQSRCLHSYSTNSSSHSNHLTPKISKQKHITSFPIAQRSPSPLQKRLADSPLHIPLAIALKKLASREQQKDDRYLLDAKQRRSNRPEIEEIKNVLQQFAQSLCTTIQREIYCKFNVQMKRMVVKYRQAQRLIKRMQQKLIMNADIFEAQHAYKTLRQKDKSQIKSLQLYCQQLTNQLIIQRRQFQQAKYQVRRLQAQNNKLSIKAERFEDILLSKIEQLNLSNASTNKSQAKLSLQPNHPNHKAKQPRFSGQPHSYDYSSINSNHVFNINQLAPTHSPLKKKRRFGERQQKCIAKCGKTIDVRQR